MEELLNKLIEKGWKPRGKENAKIFYVKEDLRDLVSKESGLWQFVCENGMLNVNKKYEWEYWTQSYKRDGEEYTHEFSRWCEKYRIVESALCDEDKLEDFILNHIIIKGMK